jgi:ribonuclease P protein component
LKIIFDSAVDCDIPAEMAVSVPKRIYKRAVDRNLLKRRVREAYRLQKPLFFEFLNEAGVHVRLVIQYRGRKIESYQLIEEKLQEALEKLKIRLVEGLNG